jgi:hypothetical protein
MADTRRERILAAIKSRLEAIDSDDGYRTNLGRTVKLGEIPRFGPDDPKQALCILPEEDQVEPGVFQEGKVPVVWPISIGILVSPDISQPWLIVEAGLRDVKVAMESGDRTLGGLLKGGRNNPGGLLRGTTETFPRQMGSEAVGAKITYAAPYWETWGDPEA